MKNFEIENNVLIKANKNIKTAEIPNGVTSIGKGAFYACTNLTSVTIPNSVTSIERRAFYWCDKLTSLKRSGE